MRYCLAVATLCTTLLLNWAAAGAGVLYKVDPGFARIGFSVDNLGGLFSTTGQFSDFSGQLLLDQDSPANSHVDVTARAGSVSTGWGAADDMLQSVDYLDPARYPELRFVSERIEVLGPDHARLHGRLTLRGVTLPQTFDARLLGRHDEPGLGPIADYVVEGQVKRDDFGMVADHPLVAPTITVRIAAHIRLEPVP